jgi:outer membrane lipoprotein-sorting protein
MEQPGSGSITTKVCTKGKKSRTVMQAGGRETINIFDGVQAYMYIPSQNMAIVVPVGQVTEQVPEVGDYKKDCEYLGQEALDGKKCGVYNCTKGGVPVKMWVDESMDFPVKMETRGMTAYYKNVVVDAPLDDSLFSLPAGVKTQDISAMMQGLKGITGEGKGDSKE